ncbi:hypothetical protein PFISCL1PPCAC_12236, partial [Pristionchus fissidentatus]
DSNVEASSDDELNGSDSEEDVSSDESTYETNKKAPAKFRPIRHPKAVAKVRFTCNKCGQTFTASSNYKKHMRSRCGTHCDKCGKGFKSMRTLIQHKQLQHGTAADAARLAAYKLKCKVCGAR